MLLAIVMGILAIASLVAFVVPLRIAMRHEDGPRTVGGGVAPGTTEFVGLSHLEVGVELKFDRQTWFVCGVQHVTAPDGATWSAWHLDDRGQGGWMATGGPDEDVVFAVRAESPETIDPALDAVTWRKHEWARTTVDGGTVRAEGERRLARRGGMAPVAPTDLERVVFARPDLPARRLVLERSAGDETWNAWIGTAVPGSMIDVWPPAGALAAPAGPGTAAAPAPGA
ncbi:hypothetical protein [Patulibacter sp.]|uniref:hypothetical protein n=1 Tax=Patulibacter sp. TaxID=1912859 RepID=UPI002716FF37|nr:hypothetical protein [Patulibacter sp.]MDO9409439.1 hypothetical protein [Patulibacter sp.]